MKPGDILVGKITPKSETELAPEERLLRAIFGEKAADVKDTSLTVPSGTYGIVMDVKVSSRKEVAKQKLTPAETKRQAKQIGEEYKKKKDELHEELTEALSNILLGEKIPLDVVNAETGEIIIPANRKITKTLLRKLAGVYDHVDIDPSPIRNKIREIISSFEHKFAELDLEKERSLDRIESGDDIDPGIIKQVKVYIASKRKLSVGDKMAGRHGNKGVVAKIVPEEDMPFLHDGTPVEIVLNPLGVPSRMNVGQVLETHLGVAAKALGFKVATPVFDGIEEPEIRKYLTEAKKVEGFTWVTETGKSTLIRWPDRRRVRSKCRSRIYLHVETRSPCGRQDSRTRGWAVLARYTTTAGWEGSVRWSAIRGNGGLGAGGVRCSLYPPGVADRKVRRRSGPDPNL